MVKTKWLLISIAMALVVGFGGGIAIESSSSIESVRRAEKQAINAQESGRAIAAEADRVRKQFEQEHAISLGLAEDKRTLTATVEQLTRKNQQAITSLQGAITDLGGINQIGRDIADTIESITRIANGIEQAYYELNK